MPVLDYRGGASPSPANTLSTTFSLLARMLPERSMPQPQTLSARDNMIAIPTVYYGLDNGPPAGTVVGATLGSVAGFILLIWLITTLMNGRNNPPEQEVIVRHERSPRRKKRSEMRSVSRGPERVIRQERIVRDTSRGPPPRSSFIVDPMERRVEGDDVVEVIEEQSSVGPRRKSRRGSGSYR